MSEIKDAMKPSKLSRRSRKRRSLLSAGAAPRSVSRSNLRFEPLEARTLLAGDMLSIETLLASSLDNTPVATQPTASAAEVLNTLGSVQLAAAAEGESQAEGEDAPDLVAFAQALTDAGVKFYGAPWCVHCTEQKELFEDGGKYLPYIDASNPDGTANQIAIDNNITSFPTWVFQDESRLTGAQSLETLSQESGIAIPTSSTPSLAELDDVTVLNGSPLHVALDGYDPNGNAITYTVTSDNPDVVPTVLDGNRSIVIDVDDYGKMVFELFEQRAPRPSERVIELAEDDFYDGIIFHRIIEGFVIQGGDPTGTGSGGSSLGDFDDQFHVDLQHNTTGLLSYAKTTDDTNDSQFFITLDPLPGQSYPRHLDFNHSIFGLLTEGQSVLEALSQVPTTSTRPDTSIVMNSVDVFTDDENGVLMLSADGATSGTANITVTATDSEGNSTQQTFQVTVGVDTINGGPFLDDIPELTTTGGVPVEFQLVGNDVEGDAIYYEAAKRGSVDYTFTVDNTTGEVTVTPPADFVGQLQIDVSARALNGSNTSDPLDSQTVTIDVLAAIPELDLLAVSDSNIDDDNITNETTLQFRVSNVTAGATVQILNGTSVIGQGTANGTSIDLATGVLGLQGDGSYTLTAIQIIDGVESDPSEELIVTLDTQAPGDITSTPPTSAINGEQITYDVDSPEEGSSGTRYSLINPPSGASIDPVTGELQWTPTPLQGGVNAFQVQLMDEAGNTTSQDISIDVTVVPQLVQIRFEAQDLGGNVITQIQAGEDFVLVVYADDLRDAGQGVFAAYMDILFDSGLIAPLDGSINDIDFELSYSNGRSGNFDTPGLIDEVGSFGPTTPTGPDEVRLFALDFVATDQGTVEFTGDGAVGIGREILVFGTNTPVAPNEVTYLPTTLEIIAGLEAIDDLFNFDEDSSDNPLDVLANDDNQSGGSAVDHRSRIHVERWLGHDRPAEQSTDLHPGGGLFRRGRVHLYDLERFGIQHRDGDRPGGSGERSAHGKRRCLHRHRELDGQLPERPGQ
jgi:cyclophilin family peptidyl-prolyl cis-trans isomerase/glutaredoxin